MRKALLATLVLVCGCANSEITEPEGGGSGAGPAPGEGRAPAPPAAPDPPKIASDVVASIAAGRPTDVIIALEAPPPSEEEIKPASVEIDPQVLGDLKTTGVTPLAAFRTFPMVTARVDSKAGLDALEANKSVTRVYADERVREYLSSTLPQIRQDVAAADGRLGAGTAVAVLDTGVDYSNPAFGTCPAPGAAGCSVAVARDFATQDNAKDAHGHGTNVAAIVLGVAPATKILALDVFDGGGAKASVILSAIDWVITNRAAHNVVAMNMSFGAGLYTGTCGSSVFAAAVAAARAQGIVPVAASGNDASKNALGSPACAPHAVSVGAVYDGAIGGWSWGNCVDNTTSTDLTTCFSNSASFLTILAPGALVTAGGTTMAGTSQAAPHVAGAVAVVKSVYPELTASQVVSKLTSSGKLVTDPKNGVKKPRLDLAAAVCSATVAPTARSVGAAGGTVTINVTTGPSCGWKTRSNASWLTLAPSDFAAKKTVLTVAANPGKARTGTVTVAGRTVTITQASR